MIVSRSGHCVVFDLDDTLYDELAFVSSGFRAVAAGLRCAFGIDCSGLLEERFNARQLTDAFQCVAERFGLPTDSVALMVSTYRDHVPDIGLRKGIVELLTDLKHRDGVLACITDGRSVTQRNKLDALGLSKAFDLVLISEETGHGKPDEHSYREVMRQVSANEYWYVGDNPAKDFVAPNALGWRTVQVECELNVQAGIAPVVPVGYAAEVRCRVTELARVLLEECGPQ